MLQKRCIFPCYPYTYIYIYNFVLYICTYIYNEFLELPRGLAWVCGRSLAGIVGSNPAGGMDVCMLQVLCVVS